MDDGFIDYTMGHTTPAVQRAYHQPAPDKLKNKYIRCLPFLTFLRQVTPLVVESEGYKKLREENEALHSQMRDQDARIGAKDSETADLRGRLDKLESALQSVISKAGKK